MAETRTETEREIASEVRQLAEEVKARAEAALRGERIGRELEGIARALRTTADQLERDNQPSTAHYARRVGDSLERVRRRIEHKSLSDLLHDLEELGRERPMAVAGVSLLIGFAAARFLRSSRSETYEVTEGEVTTTTAAAGEGTYGYHS